MSVFRAISDLFTQWRDLTDLEIGVRGRLRSLKVTWSYYGHNMTYYWSAIVNIALACTISELSDVE